jgi:hypothetical protein
MIHFLLGINEKGRVLKGFPRMSIESIAESLDLSGVDVGWVLIATLDKHKYKAVVLRSDRNSEHCGWRQWRTTHRVTA